MKAPTKASLFKAVEYLKGEVIELSYSYGFVSGMYEAATGIKLDKKYIKSSFNQNKSGLGRDK